MYTPRENLLRLLRRQGFETIPPEFVLCPHLVDVYHERERSDLPYDEYFQMPWKSVTSLVPDNDDRTRFAPYHAAAGLDVRHEVDEWGVGHRATPTSMHMTQMFCPLKDADSEEEILAYPLPTYSAAGNPGLAQEVAALKAKGIAPVGNMQITIWETAWYIRGMENLMMDMFSGEPMAEILLDRVTEMSLSRAELYARAGVDILFLGDDIGMQRTVMMKEEMYTEWLKPRLTKIIRAAKAINPDLLVFYHSCGYVEPFIPHLIEAGIDVLNPVQPECMDPEKIIKEYGGQLSFHGTIGTQSVMPFGTPEEVKETVKRNLSFAGDKGGLFVAPTHLVEPEVPWENILAYVEACKEYTR